MRDGGWVGAGWRWRVGRESGVSESECEVERWRMSEGEYFWSSVIASVSPSRQNISISRTGLHFLH